MTTKKKTASSFNPYTYHYSQIALSLAGTLLSLYLLAKHYLLKFGVQDGASFCSLGSRFDCDAVTLSPHSSIFGVPNALLGTLFYFVLFVISVLFVPKEEKNNLLQRLFSYLCALALLLDIYLLLVQIFILQNLCLLCLFSYAINAALLYCSYKLQPRGKNKWGTLFFSKLPEKKIQLSFSSRVLALTSTILFFSFLLFLPSVLKTQNQTHQMVENAMDRFFEQWKEAPNQKLEISKETPFFGNPNAKVEFLEFSDFQCPFCKKSAFTLHHFLKQNAHRIKFYFKQFPLDASCNPSLKYRMHPLACDLAKASLCANRQGTFWAFHDKAFLSLSEDKMSKIPDLIPLFQEGFFDSILEKSEFTRCQNDLTISKQLKQDIDLAQKLNIKGTPALFVNGKPFTVPITFENLSRVLNIEEK